jgi:hypothetical protein
VGEPFAMIPRSWAEPSSGLKPRDLQIAIMLFSYGSDIRHPAFPSLTTIANRMKLSRRTVQRSVNKMVRLGHVVAGQRAGTTTVYTIANFRPTLVKAGDQGPRQLPVHRVDPVVDHKSKALKRERTDEDDAAFAAFQADVAKKLRRA